jgi:hypothetical protein
MSHFSDGQLAQLTASLEAADWTPNDVTLLGQAGRDRLIGIRDSLRRGGDIVSAIVEGRTELWFHPDQERVWVRGRAILAHLTETGLLAGCADIAELEAIQAKGLPFFRKYFAGKAVFGWRGVRDGRVPYLVESDGEVVLDWYWLDSHWLALYPALRRK